MVNPEDASVSIFFSLVNPIESVYVLPLVKIFGGMHRHSPKVKRFSYKSFANKFAALGLVILNKIKPDGTFTGGGKLTLKFQVPRQTGTHSTTVAPRHFA